MNGASPGTALQRKSDTVMDGRCSKVVAVMPPF
jgi:hypothetical protein